MFRDKIVAEIMSLVRQSPRKMEPKPTIAELEAILNSECTDEISVQPDGSICVTSTSTTVGAVADKVIAALRDTISTNLNAHLIEMKPDMDDSIIGFNEAWDIVRKVLE